MLATITFDQAFDRLLGHEGGYSNNSRDRGGETNWGISKASYPNVDIRNLTRDGAKVIYRRDFWDVLADTVHPSIKFQLFDFAVNSGIRRAIKGLQEACRVTPDGAWGPKSQAAIAAMDHNDVLFRILGVRLRFMASLSPDQWGTFGRGWANRIADNLLYAADDN